MLRATVTLALSVLVVAVVPAVALACPVCFSGTEENRAAYFLTFVLLTVLPLLSIGGLVFWIARRYRHAE